MNKRFRGENGSDMSTSSGCVHPYPAVRLRGLPFTSSPEEIADFLDVRPLDIVIQERNARPTGVAYVLAANPDDYRRCIDKNKQHLGTRYIEVFPCARPEFYNAIADLVRGPIGRSAAGYERDTRGGRQSRRDYNDKYPGENSRRPPPIKPDPVHNPRNIEAVVKLRGLPFDATPSDVCDWINEKARNKDICFQSQVVAQDVVVATKGGTSTGIAFVEFKYHQDAERILPFDRHYLGNRYVEVSLSTIEEQQKSTGAV